MSAPSREYKYAFAFVCVLKAELWQPTPVAVMNTPSHLISLHLPAHGPSAHPQPSTHPPIRAPACRSSFHPEPGVPGGAGLCFSGALSSAVSTGCWTYSRLRGSVVMLTAGGGGAKANRLAGQGTQLQPRFLQTQHPQKINRRVRGPSPVSADKQS